jgi:hypothetical protein
MELCQMKSHCIAVEMVACRRAPMVTDKEMEGYARDCASLADLTDDPEIREQLLDGARVDGSRAWQQPSAGSG